MKIVFFDIDGTLWDEKMQIPESTIEAIRKLRENGNKAFLCSGRARGNIIDERLFAIGFDGVIAACGNHVEMDGKVLYERLLSKEQVRTIVEVTEKYNMPIVLEGPNMHFISRKGFENDPYIEYLEKKLGDGAKRIDGYSDEMIVNKFSADVKPFTDYESIKDKLLEFLDPIWHVGNIVEFVPKGTSKATGIEWLRNYLGIDIGDIYAVGDSINDVDMLKYAGHSIAMGNGTDVAKESAEYITTDIHDDGIKNALLHYNLI